MNIPMIIPIYPQNDPIIIGYTHHGIPIRRHLTSQVRALHSRGGSQDQGQKRLRGNRSVWRAAWDDVAIFKWISSQAVNVSYDSMKMACILAMIVWNNQWMLTCYIS